MSGSTSVLELLRNPRDPNWQNGPHRGHHLLLFLKTIFTIILISLIIVEYPIWVEQHKTWTWDKAYAFWWRSGAALVPDLLYTFVAFALIFQKPRIVISGRTWTFHPAFALTFSIILLVLYVFVGTVNLLTVYGLERQPQDLPAWAQIGLAQVAFEFTLALVYLWLLVLACVAVHRWRKRKEVAQVADRAIELVEGMEHGKMDGQ